MNRHLYAHALERLTVAVQSLTEATPSDLEGCNGSALSPQGRLESAAITLLGLRPSEFDSIPHARALFESIVNRLTAQESGPDDPEECGSIRATCSHLTDGECAQIGADLLRLFWLVER